jgi:D-alanyl-D-alanine carboxypeptidase
MFLRLLLAVAFVAVSAAAPAQPPAVRQPAAPQRPMAIYVAGAGAGTPAGSAEGEAAPGVPLTADTPLRIASNTKTFVAATVLRLWEQGRIDLDAPIGPLLTPSLDTLLRADGFDTGRITVRQLMSHSAGLYDHGGDPRYIAAVTADPAHVWTREEQLRLAMTWADPLSPPGTEFRYSDTGYILLGDIVERITGATLARAVRDALRLDRLGLTATWWERFEQPPAGAAARARQWLGEREVTGLDPSLDLYGGGGQLMSARDLATLFAALFEGRIFDRPETLREMLWQGPHRGAELYRLGVFVTRVGDEDFYWHSGFWGTLVYYSPRRRLAVAGVTTNQDGFRRMRAAVEQRVGLPPR